MPSSHAIGTSVDRVDERLQLSGALEVMADGLLNVPWPSNWGCRNSRKFEKVIENDFDDVLDGTFDFFCAIDGDIRKKNQ